MLARVAKQIKSNHRKMKESKYKFIHCKNVALSKPWWWQRRGRIQHDGATYLFNGDGGSRKKGAMFAPTHIPAGIEQKKRTLALSHSVTLPLSQTERQHSWLCKHTSCQTAGWAIRNSVSIFCWYWVRFAFPCPGHSMCINKPLSRRDETHCRMEGCSAPVKLKAEVNGQSKRGERCYGHQWRLFVRGLGEVFTWYSENCQTWQTSTKTETFMTIMQHCMMRQTNEHCSGWVLNQYNW